MFFNTFIFLKYLPVLLVTNTKSVHSVSCPTVGWAAPAAQSPSWAPPALWVRTPEPAAPDTGPASSASCQDRPSTTTSTDTCLRGASVTSTPLPTPPALPPPTCSLAQNEERRCRLFRDGEQWFPIHLSGSRIIQRKLAFTHLILPIKDWSSSNKPLGGNIMTKIWSKSIFYTYIYIFYLFIECSSFLFVQVKPHTERNKEFILLCLITKHIFTFSPPTKVKCFCAICVILTEMAAPRPTSNEVTKVNRGL